VASSNGYFLLKHFILVWFGLVKMSGGLFSFGGMVRRALAKEDEEDDEYRPVTRSISSRSNSGAGFGGYHTGLSQEVARVTIEPVVVAPAPVVVAPPAMKELTITGYIVRDGKSNHLIAPSQAVFVYDASVEKDKKAVEKRMKEISSAYDDTTFHPFNATTMVEEVPTRIAGLSHKFKTFSLLNLKEKETIIINEEEKKPKKRGRQN
jgi:hypothetical protein